MDRILAWNEIKIFDIERAKIEITLKILISYKIVENFWEIYSNDSNFTYRYIYIYIYRQLFPKIFNTYIEILSIV